MSQSTPEQIERARAYEALLVPALMGQWTAKIADRIHVRAGDRVLDVACGTGVVAREIVSRVGPSGSVSAIDPNLGMLAVAREIEPRVDWREGVADSLPFPSESFDAVVCQFGLMFFPDRRQALLEATRVLKPGGRLGVVVWDSLEENPVYATMVALLDRIAGRHAADILGAPFVLGARGELLALFADPGVVPVEVTTERGTARFPSVRIMVESDLRGWLPLVGVVLPEDQIARILADAERLLEPYVGQDGSVTFPISAHIVQGVKP